MKHYDCIVIGAGPAGFDCAKYLALNNKKVLIIEKKHLGGCCTNYGCIPTKSIYYFLKSFNKISTFFNIKLSFSDYEKIIDNALNIVKQNRKAIEYTLKKLNIDIEQDKASVDIQNKKVILSNNKEFSADKIIIATGSKPSIPEIFQNNKNILFYKDILFEKKLPSSIAIIGAGIIGVEAAFIFSHLDIQVYLIEKEKEILPFLDKDISLKIKKNLIKNKVKIITDANIFKIEDKKIYLENKENIEVQKIILCTGIKPYLPEGIENIKITQNFNLENNQDIFLIGDVNSKSFTAYEAMTQAKIVADFINGKISTIEFNKIIPYNIYASPETSWINSDNIQNLKQIKIDYSMTGYAKITNQRNIFVKLYIDENNIIKAGSATGDNAIDIIHFLKTLIINNQNIESLKYIHPIHLSSIEPIINYIRENY